MTATTDEHHDAPRAERKRSNQHSNGRKLTERQKQDALLGGVAEAARRLLAIADFDAAVNGALEAIATAAGIDRIFVYQHQVDVPTRREYANCPYEWTVPGIVRSCDLPDQFPMFYDKISGYTDWLAELKAGRAVQKLAKEMSDAGQQKQLQEQAQSVLTVPIFIGGNYWGNFGFDDCTTERVWSEADIAVLETAAASFAGALQRRGNEAELKQRDALLNSVNAAAQCLVAIDDLERAIPESLRILGERTQQDRVYVFENVFPKGPDEVFWEVAYEWVKKGVPASEEVTASEWPIPMASFPPEIMAPFLDGQAIQFLTSVLEGKARAVNEEGQTLSLIAVPIAVSGQWWGVLGFDDCTTERVWSDAEVAVLETAAACLGSAIERERTRKEREAVVRARELELETHNQVLARRDRILQATATASNVLLNGENFDASVSEALAILGESLGFDRIAVGQQFDDRTGESSGFVRFLYEWDGPGISAQLQHYEDMADFYWDEVGLRSWYEANLRGEAFGQVLEDLPEPFRTLQQSVDVKSTHNIPIFVEGEFWGVFGIDHCREKKLLSAVELVALKTAANCVGGAIARDRARKEREAAARARSEELAQVNSVLKDSLTRLASEPDLNAFLGYVIDSINNAVGAAKGHVFLHDAHANTLELLLSVQQGTVHIGATEDEPRLFHSAFPADITPAYPEMYKTDEIVLFSLIQETQAIWPGNAEWHRRCGHVEAAAVTLRSGNRPIGMLGLCFTEPVAITNEGKTLINALADQAAVAIELARLAEENKQTAVVREREAAARARAEELEAHNQALAERDRILEATAAAANVMLTDEDFNSAVNSALQIIGMGLGVDRVGLMKKFDSTDNTLGYHQQIFEWTGIGLPSQLDHPELVRISECGIEYLGEQLARGEIFGGIVVELPEPFRSGQQELGVQSTYAVPVMVDSDYWGLIGLDDCHRQTRRSEAELEALRTLANCIGSAIEREQLRQAELQAHAAREAAERAALIERERAARAAELETANAILTTRERWLQTTATAANQLLSSNDVAASVNVALATIGENLDCDRITVMEYIRDPNASPDDLGLMRVLYEWFTEGIASQSDDPELRDIPADGIEDWFRQFLNGQYVGGVVAELEEPFRSSQQKLGVKSTYGVPVFVEGTLWGIVAMDHCREARRLSAAELAVFRTAATCVGSAIYQARVRRDRAARERARLLSSVAEAANLLLRSEDYTTVLPEVTRLLGEAVECDRCSIGQDVAHPNSDRSAVKIRADWEWCSAATLASGEFSPNGDGLFHWDDAPYIAAKLRNAEVANVLVPNLPEPDRTIMSAQGNFAELYVPITVNERLWGFIAFDNCGESRLYDEAEISILRVAAESIASAISRQAQDEALRDAEKAVLEEKEKAARDRAAELTKTNHAIRQTLDALTATPELEGFLGTILTQIVEQIQAACAYLFLYDNSTHTLQTHIAVRGGEVYKHNAPGDPEILRHPIPADITPFWQVLTNSTVPFTLDENHPQAAELFWPTTVEWHESLGHKSSTCICLKLGNIPIGFVGFAFTQYTALTHEQLEFIQALANQATLAIHLTRLAEDAKQTAILQE
ncbi:MAG: GAF domain-containing protein [Cyanobacteria bacterium P01_E01_bin.34]